MSSEAEPAVAAPCTLGSQTAAVITRCTAHVNWQRLSARVIARHRGQHGNYCPGFGRDAHPAIDLTADHVVPLAAGGATFDIGNLAVPCRSCNSTKGAAEPDRGDHTRVPSSWKTAARTTQRPSS